MAWNLDPQREHVQVDKSLDEGRQPNSLEQHPAQQFWILGDGIEPAEQRQAREHSPNNGVLNRAVIMQADVSLANDDSGDLTVYASQRISNLPANAVRRTSRRLDRRSRFTHVTRMSPPTRLGSPAPYC